MSATDRLRVKSAGTMFTIVDALRVLDHPSVAEVADHVGVPKSTAHDHLSTLVELDFVVNHVGMPRLDDFCWIAAQEPNVYGGIAVAAPMVANRPKKFGEIMGELLYWIGEDRILFGSDYALWNPDWLVDMVMNAEMTEEQKAEYGVELSLDVMKKVMGQNAADLYNIDIEEKKKQFQDDQISQEFGLGEHYGATGASAD